MTSLITATFKTRTAAETALQHIEDLGVKQEQISLIVTDETRGNSFNIKEDSKIDEGIATGAATGGLIGTIIGALSTAGAMAIPGVNIVIVGGLVSALAGLGAGAMTGGLVGGLIGAGIPEHEAKIYENQIKDGAILVAIKAENDNQKKKIKEILEHEDAHNLAA